MYLQSENYIVLCRFADVYQYICLPFQDDNYISTLQEKEKKKEREKKQERKQTTGRPLLTRFLESGKTTADNRVVREVILY